MKPIIYSLFILFLITACKSKKKAVENVRTPQKETAVGDNSTPSTPVEIVENAEVIYPVIQTTEDYISLFKNIAIENMYKYGIPASITLAQGILESASGKARLAEKANNHFGIKCHDWTGSRIYHDDDERQECFRKYNNPLESFEDHALFLTQRKRYDPLFTLSPTDYKSWAKALKKAGYATDKAYPQKLIKIIERHDLHQYDLKPETPEYTIYTVQKGDTLFSLSKAFDVSVDTIKFINNLSSDLITVGQKLKLNTLNNE